jgi:hypothetical protein
MQLRGEIIVAVVWLLEACEGKRVPSRRDNGQDAMTHRSGRAFGTSPDRVEADQWSNNSEKCQPALRAWMN